MKDDLHKEATEAFEEASEAASDNHDAYRADFKFSRLSEQWPEEIKKLRSTPGAERPMFTFNKLTAFGRQVVNDIRQNRPAIKVRPVDSAADQETALVMQGLIRNIEHSSNAAVAYDTAAECAVYGGFGYWAIDYDYSCDDSFDMDIMFRRIGNPLSVLGDPYSTAADSSDWNIAFEFELMSERMFEASFPNADKISFESMDDKVRRNWTQGKDILVASYWKRDKVKKKILLLSNGLVVAADTFAEDKDVYDAAMITVQREREIESYRVRQCILNGQEVLTKRYGADGKETDRYEWPGKYIPIIPVYGDEINIEGKRIFQSMIHDAKDAQQQYNLWETTAAELVALAPKVPWVGAKGSFDTDPNWGTANTANHAFLEYDPVPGANPPSRNQLDSGPALGAMAQSRAMSDNIKSVLGMYDASLGNRSNETSGVAIERRQKEGDVGQFHFSDNLMRAVRHSGIVIADLIPHVYTKGRVVRVLGEDGAMQSVQIGDRQRPEMPQDQGAAAPMPPKIGALQGVFDLGMGKYDLVVEAGPSYTTQRQETSEIIGKLAQAYPPLMQIGGDILVRNLDFKDGDELAQRLKKTLPANLQGDAAPQIPPEVQQMIEQGKAMIAQLQEQNAQLQSADMKGKADIAKAELDGKRVELDTRRLPIEEMQAQEKLAIAQKDLLLTQAQVGAETAQVVANTDAVTMLTAAAAQLSDAAAQIAAVASAASVPKIKEIQIERTPTGFRGVSVEGQSVQ